MKSIDQLAREHFANAIISGDVTLEQCVAFCRVIAEQHDNILFQTNMQLVILAKERRADVARLQARIDGLTERARAAVVALGFDANIC